MVSTRFVSNDKNQTAKITWLQSYDMVVDEVLLYYEQIQKILRQITGETVLKMNSQMYRKLPIQEIFRFDRFVRNY